jgi:hypothetical protein
MLTLMLGLLGCNAEATDIEGIWALMLPNLQDVEEDCSEAISHNFTEGQVPEEDDEIETRFDEEIETTRSDQMTLVQIVRSDVNKDEAMLFAGARAYPGKETDKGSWLFTWEGSEITDRTQTHVDGYEYTELIDEARVASIRVNVSKDAWSEEITEIDANGQMPSSTYLVVEIGSGSLTPLFNSRDRADCDGDACELELDISCTNEREFSAIKTGFDDETVYEDVAGAGQQAGT